MNGPDASVKNAATLIYKALHTSLVTANDNEYRELVALYQADAGFRGMCQDVATGLELQVLSASEQRGLIVVPASRESRFAVRLADIRSAGMDPAQKAVLVLAHVSVCAVFFPTTDALDDDNFAPAPTTVATCRDTLMSLAKRLKETQELPADIPVELAPGWEAACSLPMTVREGMRASTSSVVGAIKLALNQLQQHGLVRLDRGTEDDAEAQYTATYRLRVQVRELALRRLFEMAQLAVTAPMAA